MKEERTPAEVRKSYIEQIRSQKKDFVFFFYRKKGEVFYPVHNLLPCCGKFIGYNPGCHFFVKGKIAAPENEQTIKTCEKEELFEQLEQSGYKNATRGNADSYYTVKITDIEIVQADSDEIEKLKSAIDDFDGNDILSEHSPKVVWGGAERKRGDNQHIQSSLITQYSIHSIIQNVVIFFQKYLRFLNASKM